MHGAGVRGWTVSVWSTMSWLNLSTWVSPSPIPKVSEDRSDSPNSWYLECLYEEVFDDHYDLQTWVSWSVRLWWAAPIFQCRFPILQSVMIASLITRLRELGTECGGSTLRHGFPLFDSVWCKSLLSIQSWLRHNSLLHAPCFGCWLVLDCEWFCTAWVLHAWSCRKLGCAVK